jgi:ribose transport system substrate-binding protein
VLPINRHKRAFWALGALLMLVCVTACGSASSSGSSSAASSAAATGANSSSAAASSAAPSSGSDVSLTKVVAPGVPSLAQLYAGSTTSPPTTSPAGAKGKSVWWISCSQGDPSCTGPAAEAAAGAKKLGINFHIADGKFDVGGAFNTAMNTALAAHPDAIILYGVACELVKGQLEQAKAQHIIVLGVNTPDCSDSGGPQLFNVHMIPSSKFPTEPDFWKAYGAATADYLIDATGGKAKVIDNAGTEPLQKMVDAGFTGEIKKCSGCAIVATVPYDSAQLTPNGPWISAFRSTLVKTPQANAVYLPFDVFDQIGGAQAVASAGHKIISAGGQAVPYGLNFVRRGMVSAEGGAQSDLWSGDAGIDAVNRALMGKPQVPEGEGFALLTPNHPGFPTANQAYQPKIDFPAIYAKAWNDGKGS